MRRMYSKNQLEEESIELLGSGKVPNIKADKIIENMEGYSYNLPDTTNWSKNVIYAGAVKNGNKLTFVIAIEITKNDENANSYPSLGEFTIPNEVADKIFPSTIGGLDNVVDTKQLTLVSTSIVSQIGKYAWAVKDGNKLKFSGFFNINADTKYYLRYEMTILLSENLAE